MKKGSVITISVAVELVEDMEEEHALRQELTCLSNEALLALLKTLPEARMAKVGFQIEQARRRFVKRNPGDRQRRVAVARQTPAGGNVH